ncbi:DUF389 domain-containing protein [Actinomadura sp. 3N407]|uniref:DUF389 domain-containing protein n=1 Tax=Actinomadura sp. 3N407 TaxID=3457423 RepID=UPI003FCD6E1C
MPARVRDRLVPATQRRTPEELTADLDLRSGKDTPKLSAFWTMLIRSALITAAGVMADSTATVIGAMVIAPLSTPIMGVALGLVKRTRTGAGRFVLGVAAAVVAVGLLASLAVPRSYDLLSNTQISGRTSPGLADLLAAMATGLVGAVALARRDVAAVMPGVAIAISLVPPLVVAGVCLGDGAPVLACGALVLFLSNFLCLVLAGTFVFAALGYRDTAPAARTPTRAALALRSTPERSGPDPGRDGPTLTVFLRARQFTTRSWEGPGAFLLALRIPVRRQTGRLESVERGDSAFPRAGGPDGVRRQISLLVEVRTTVPPRHGPAGPSAPRCSGLASGGRGVFPASAVLPSAGVRGR